MASLARATTATTLCLVAGLLSLAGTAQAQSPLLEVEKSDATKLLQVTDDAGFLVRGAVDVGTIPAAGAGVRLMWYPGKAASGQVAWTGRNGTRTTSARGPSRWG